MDTVTQALLGAAVGQAGFSSRLGRRAVGWGAVGGLIPDLDVLAVPMTGPFGEFLYHRGFTHALWFGPVVGPLLGYAVWRRYARRSQRRDGAAERAGPDPGAPEARNAWMGLFVLALFTHPLLDLFTVYGTQLLAPFSRARFALNGVGIIDPIYSLMLVAALLLGRRWRERPLRAQAAAFAALGLSTLYLFYGLHLNHRAEGEIAALLRDEGRGDFEVRVYPTILQPWLRRVVARSPDEVRVGLHTSFRPGEPRWDSFSPMAHPLLDRLEGTREGSIFVWFAMGEVAGRVRPDARGSVVEIEDLRYGVPGPPDQGLWGIRAVFDRRGRLLEPVVRFNRPRGLRPGALLRGLWRATWGDLSALGTELGRPS